MFNHSTLELNERFKTTLELDYILGPVVRAKDLPTYGSCPRDVTIELELGCVVFLFCQNVFNE